MQTVTARMTTSSYPWIDLNTVGITDAEPLLRDLGHFVTTFANRVFVIQDVALDFQIGAILDLDSKTIVDQAK